MHLYRCLDQLFQASKSSAIERFRTTAANISGDTEARHIHQEEILSAKYQ